MNSLRVVKRLDVFEDARASFHKIFIATVLRPFVFQRPEEPLHDGVVVTASCSAHRALNVQRAEDSLKRVTGVLTPAITMMKQRSGLRPPRFNRFPQGFGNDRRR